MIPVKPRLRGHFHQGAFFVAVGACAMLLLKATDTLTFVGLLVYSLGMIFMLGVSSLYHRINWQPEARTLMKKLDHVGIYIMIAGTFTPVCLMALSPESGRKLLIIIWTAAALGTFQSLVFIHAPKWLSAILYITIGYFIVPYLPELKESMGFANVVLIMVGGLLYTIGAVTYALKKPNFYPQTFGYHEVFHLFVIFGALAHFVMIYRLVS